LRIQDFGLLADENIHNDVIAFLQHQGFDVRTVRGTDLQGWPDLDLIRLAYAEGRVIVTHDRDFGRLAIAADEALYGIVYLRPGHLDPSYHVATVSMLLRHALDLQPPFLLVARRRADQINIRLRHLR